MICDTCSHKKVCSHYNDIRTEAYAYMGVRFDPEADCQEYISSNTNYELNGKMEQPIKLKKCPFCGGIPRIIVCDDEGNHHSDEYEDDPWSGLGFMLYHDEKENPNCPIAHEEEAQCGRFIYDSRKEAALAWNRRTKD